MADVVIQDFVEAEGVKTLGAASSEKRRRASPRNTKAIDFLTNMETFLELAGNYWPSPVIPSHFRCLPCTRKAAILLGRLNTVVYLIVSCLNLSRWILLVTEELSFTGRLAMTAMLMIIAIYSLAYFFATARNLPRNYPKFRDKLSQVLEDGSFCSLLPSSKSVLAVFHVLPAVWTVLAMWKSMFSSETDMMTSIRFYPLNPSSRWYAITKALYCYLNIMSGIQSVQLMGIIAVSSVVIVREFSRLDRDVGQLGDGESYCLEEDSDLEKPRRRHYEVCELVSLLDVLVRGPVFLHYSSSISYTCLLLYCMSKSLLSLGSLVGAGASGLAVVVWVIVLTALGARLTETAHSVRENLCKFNASRLSQAGFQSLTLFLAQVSGPPIGFTALGLFTIDRTVFLTVAGTLVTYALVLFQFNTGGDNSVATAPTPLPLNLSVTAPLA